MSWEAVSGVANVVLAIGVPVTLTLTFYGIRKAGRDERYAQYVGRYQKIITNLPYNVFAKHNKIAELPVDEKVWLVAYIDLCAQELFDRQRNSIEKKVWDNWSESIREYFNRCIPLQEVFKEIKVDYPELSKFLGVKKVSLD
jgi:hypothetical protein